MSQNKFNNGMNRKREGCNQISTTEFLFDVGMNDEDRIATTLW